MNDKKIRLLKKVNATLKDSMNSCRICPRRCGVDRRSSDTGYCRSGIEPAVYSYLSHYGEEPPISGKRGSGTIFFSHCNMKCAYCQNYYFSQLDKGDKVSIERLSEIMLGLEREGCHNINLVTPTHYMPQILRSLEIAISSGLSIPIVYNTSGYELADMIGLLDGIVDIYLPDMRYSDNAMAKRYSDASRYVEENRAAVAEMFRQVGNLRTDASGVAVGGMIIRLLAIPNNVSGTIKTLKFLKETIGDDVCLSLMSQYYPTFKACSYAEISSNISKEEYANIIDESHGMGLNNGWVQEEPVETDPKFLGTNIKQKGKS